jgi:hypothetical protein
MIVINTLKSLYKEIKPFFKVEVKCYLMWFAGGSSNGVGDVGVSGQRSHLGHMIHYAAMLDKPR